MPPERFEESGTAARALPLEGQGTLDEEVHVILSFNFEELRALASGADLLLSEPYSVSGSAVAAPAEALMQVEILRGRLTGDISVATLAQQRAIRSAVGLIRDGLHERLEAAVLEYHPAHEEPVALYFDYAHSVTVLRRLDEMGSEMNAMIELITGTPADPATAASVTFPDDG